jgi:hypothetical protein
VQTSDVQRDTDGQAGPGTGPETGPDNASATAVVPDQMIVCVDCGGDAYLLTPPDEDGRYFDGDIVAYRCRDCLDRWDIELEAPDVNS